MQAIRRDRPPALTRTTPHYPRTRLRLLKRLEFQHPNALDRTPSNTSTFNALPELSD